MYERVTCNIFDTISVYLKGVNEPAGDRDRRCKIAFSSDVVLLQNTYFIILLYVKVLHEGDAGVPSGYLSTPRNL